ncbi:MAG: DUF4185 domain-containing protein [Acidobacteria bacterium]|nr:DUF4185 domain-containing protein [Acidobacteriota bacterium]
MRHSIVLDTSHGAMGAVSLRAAMLVLLPLVCAAQPYPQSTIRLSWDSAVVKIGPGSGDNWPIAWDRNGVGYTSYGDGKGFADRSPRLSLGFAKIYGDPPGLRAEDLPSNIDTPQGGGNKAIKASGMLMVDGVLYMFVRNYRVNDDFRHSRLAWSSDFGRTWTWAGWHFSGTFGCPEFVQFGPDYAGARDGYVYMVSQDNDSAYGYAPGIVMARVPKNKIAARDAWEFYAGPNRWTRNLDRRRPVFTDPKGTQRVAITYNAARKRYFLTTSHRTADETHTPALGVFDAPEPWGPWTTVYYDDHWSGTFRTYHHKFPTRWMSRDGGTMWLLYSGLDGGLYAFCLKKATLE